ncbi:MAG: NAD(P)/FAD-dependent oxidoreductase [bacterium]
MYDSIIIGLGPAGIQAAIYLKRFNFNVLLIGAKDSNLCYAKSIDNYYGVLPVGGKELFEIGLKQATDLNIDIKEEMVLGIENQGTFVVKTKENEYEGKTVFIATGAAKAKLPGINFQKYESNGLSYCAICDSFFYRNKNIALIGTSDYMASELEVLQRITDKITIFTNGKPLEVETKFPVVTDKIKEFYGQDYLEGIKTDKEYNFDGVFVAVGSASSFDFAKHLGLLLDEKNKIIVNDVNMTNVVGIYAGGDNTGEPLQIAKAVYDGMTVAFAIKEQLKEE